MRDAIIDSELAADLRQANASRAEFDRFLASLYLYELTADQVEALAGVAVEDDGSDVARGLGIIREYLRHRDRATPQALAVDYAHVRGAHPHAGRARRRPGLLPGRGA